MRQAFLLGAFLLSPVDANADGLTLLQLHDISSTRMHATKPVVRDSWLAFFLDR